MMERRTMMTALVLLAACSPQPADKGKSGANDGVGESSGTGYPDPVAVVRPLYQRYLTDPAATTFPTLEEQAPWSDAMRGELVAMIARSRVAQEPILDFDPFVGAQDWQITDLNVATESVAENSHAVVRVRFNNIGQPKEVVHDMIWQGGSWRVHNIRGPGYDLREVITAPATP